jgi:uncharacterized membrane protein YfcA
MPEYYFLFLFLAFLAEIIGTISGFGSSIVFVPLAAQFFSIQEVLGITAVFHVFSNLSKLWLFKTGIDKKIVLVLGSAAVVSVSLGALLASWLPPMATTIFMSVSLMVLAIFLILKPNFQWRSSNKHLLVGGTLSGFLAGATGTGGAIRGLTMMAFNLEKGVFIATSAAVDLGVDFTRAVIYLLNGFASTHQLLLYVPPLAIISFIGSYTGKRLLGYFSQKTFRYVVLGVIIVSAAIELIKVIHHYS